MEQEKLVEKYFILFYEIKCKSFESKVVITEERALLVQLPLSLFLETLYWK